jgi:hypothetical protein
MDGEIVTRLVDMIKAKVPQADQRDPLSVSIMATKRTL